MGIDVVDRHGEVRDDPGALPLLSHALLETWQRREGNTLTVDGYHASGGIHGAVAQSAEHLYGRIEPDQRRRLRDLVLRLVSPGANGEAVRTRAPRRLMASDPDHERLIESLVAARLVTSDEGVLEITHEALARAWPRLRGWLEDDVEGQRIRHHLSGAADAWDSLGRPESELYRGVRLTRALDWAASTDSALTDTERDFLAASRETAEVEEQSAAERARVQGRLISRLRVVLIGAMVLLVLAVAGGAVALVQSNRASDNAEAARSSELRAVARSAAAGALVSDDPDVSMPLAVAAARLDESPETHNSLLALISRRPRLYASTPIEGDLPKSIDASPDGRFVAILDESHHLRLYDARSGALVGDRQLGPPLIQAGDVTGRRVLFSPESHLLAVTRTPGRAVPVALLDVPTLQVAQRLPGLPRRGFETTDLAFSADGSRLAAGLHRVRAADTAGESPNTALVWHLGTSSPPVSFRLGEEWTPSVALDDEGQVLYSAGPLTRHTLSTRTSRVLDPSSRDLWDLEVVADGTQILALDGATPRLFDAIDGTLITGFEKGRALIALRTSPDKRRFIAVGWESREVFEWRVGEPSSPVNEFSLDRGNASAADYSADGTFLHAVGRGGTALRRWDLTGEREYVRTVPTSPGASGRFSVMAQDAGRSVTITGDGGWDLTDYGTGKVTTIAPLSGYRHTYGAFHPDGRHFTTAIGPAVRVWRITSGRPTGQRAHFPGGRITELDYTADGTRLVVSELGGRVTMLDGETLRPLGVPVDLQEPVSWVVARPDGRTAVVLLGGVEPSGDFLLPSTGWALVDLVRGDVVRRGELRMPYAYWLAVSPDGRFATISGGMHGDAGSKAGAEGLLEVIDLDAGSPAGPAQDWAGNPRSQVVYSPDGARLLTSSPNGVVAVWDATTVTPTATLAVPGASLLTAAFLPDGRSARILDWSTGVAYDWDLSLDSAVEFACRAAGRDLGRQEWATHFGDLPFRETCPD